MRKGPYLQDLGPDSAAIRLEIDPPWSGAGAGRTDLEITGPDGKSRRLSATTEPKSAFTAFQATGLSPKTAYKYRIVFVEGGKDVAASEGEGSFVTAPPPGESTPVRFVVYGDNRSDDAAHAGVVRALAGSPADFLLHTGDFVEDGSNELQWQRAFEIERGLLRERCVFAAVGNHELLQPTGENFLRYFGAEPPAADGGVPPDRRRFFRTVRWGTLRIFFLNAMDTFTSTEEKKWLEGELAKSASEPGITFRFAVLHHGPYSSGPHGPNPRLWNSGMVDMLREQRVDLVWSGHDHIYERGDAKGMKYVVSGGGGAPLYPIRKRTSSTRVAESAHHFIEVKVDGQEFSMIAKRTDGSALDKCGFAKGGPWDCDRQPKAAEPVAPTPPPTPPAPSSRCGCDVPGMQVPHVAEGAAAVGALALACLRRRRRARLSTPR